MESELEAIQDLLWTVIQGELPTDLLPYIKHPCQALHQMCACRKGLA